MQSVKESIDTGIQIVVEWIWGRPQDEAKRKDVDLVNDVDEDFAGSSNIRSPSRMHRKDEEEYAASSITASSITSAPSRMNRKDDDEYTGSSVVRSHIRKEYDDDDVEFADSDALSELKSLEALAAEADDADADRELAEAEEELRRLEEEAAEEGRLEAERAKVDDAICRF